MRANPTQGIVGRSTRFLGGAGFRNREAFGGTRSRSFVAIETQKLVCDHSERDIRMTTKPLIGLNADFRSAAGQTPAYLYQAAGYFRAIQAAGAVPLILPPTHDLDSIQAALDCMHGFLLVGGADLDPRND